MGPFDLDLQVEWPSEASEEYVEELGLTSSGGVSGTEEKMMGAARCCCCGCKVDNIPIWLEIPRHIHTHTHRERKRERERQQSKEERRGVRKLSFRLSALLTLSTFVSLLEGVGGQKGFTCR